MIRTTRDGASRFDWTTLRSQRVWQVVQVWQVVRASMRSVTEQAR